MPEATKRPPRDNDGPASDQCAGNRVSGDHGRPDARPPIRPWLRSCTPPPIGCPHLSRRLAGPVRVSVAGIGPAPADRPSTARGLTAGASSRLEPATRRRHAVPPTEDSPMATVHAQTAENAGGLATPVPPAGPRPPCGIVAGSRLRSSSARTRRWVQAPAFRGPTPAPGMLHRLDEGPVKNAVVRRVAHARIPQAPATQHAVRRRRPPGAGWRRSRAAPEERGQLVPPAGPWPPAGVARYQPRAAARPK